MMILEKVKALHNMELSKNAEETANRYAFRCITITYSLFVVIWILTNLNVFIIDKHITNMTLLESTILYLLGVLVCVIGDTSKPYMKYFLMTWAVALITCITAHMTYHATVASVVPIVFTSIYSSERLRTYTIALMSVGTTVSVYFGYYFGICDANMVLLTTTSLDKYLAPDNTFLLTAVNDNPLFTLALFYVFPRILLILVLGVMARSISRIISMNTNYATEMRHLAERDQMTGVYTKSKYIDMIENDYINEEHIAIIFWDINYLKLVNDTLGHEYGDKLIFTVANSIRSLNTNNDKTYRIGGDEFVMVLRGGTEKTVKDKITRWRASLQNYEPIGDIPLSASYGYAWGVGKDIHQIIRDADQMMYENKRLHHQLDGSQH